MKLGKEVAFHDERAQCYAFPSNNEANMLDVVITGNILVRDRMNNVLFDPCSTYYYVSVRLSS